MKNILILLMSLLLSQTLTAQEPELIYDFESDCGWSTEWQFTKVGEKLFFRGCTNEGGRELWMTDGTASGTEMITEIVSGEGNGLTETSKLKVTLGNDLFFVNKFTSADDLALWKTDGTAEGTGIIAEGNLTIVGNSPPVLKTYGEHVYFYGHNSLTDEEGILKTDGTAEGTQLVISEADFLTNGRWIIEEDKIFYFKFEAGESKIKFYDLITNEIGTIETNTSGDLRLSYLSYHNGKLIYIVEIIADGQIWRADTNEMVGEPISDIIANSGFIFIHTTDSPLLYFGSSPEKKLYSKYGDEENVILVSEEIGNYGSLVSDKIVIGNNLYFVQNFDLWSSDGTLSGTGQLFEGAELPHKADEYLYYNDDNTQEENYLRRFKEEDPIATDEQVGSSELDIYKPELFNSQLENKLVFVARSGLYAIDLQPSSILNRFDRTQLEVFPNPTQTELRVSLPNSFYNNEVEVSIQNTSGRVLLTQKIIGAEFVNLTLPADLMNGIYFLKFSTGGKTAFSKVMVLK